MTTEKTEFEKLMDEGKRRGFTIGTFSTHAPNFYEDAVLYVAVGNPINRNSHLVLDTWDVSYSQGKTPTLKNKLGRAMAAAWEYIRAHDAPNPDDLTDMEMRRRKNSRNDRRQTRTREIKNKMVCFCQQQTEIESSEALTPVDAVDRGYIPSLETFGYNDAERAELIQEKSLRLWNGSIMIFEGQLGEPAQWRRFSQRPHDSTGCLRHP